MSDTPADVRALRDGVARTRRWMEWQIIGNGIAAAIIGPLSVALFLRGAWLDIAAGHAGLVSLDAMAAGALAVITWRATRFARKFRDASAAFDAAVAELNRHAYQRGRDDAKAATIELLRHLGQSFANATGASFELMFEGEHIVCEPKEGWRGQRVPAITTKH